MTEPERAGILGHRGSGAIGARGVPGEGSPRAAQGSPGPARKEVVVTAADAAARVSDGMTIIIGGFVTANHPMPVVRELIKRGVGDLTVIGSAHPGPARPPTD